MDKGKRTSNGISAGRSVWASRFMAAAIIQGAAIVGLTIFLVLGQTQIKPEVSRVIAGGGAGTWLAFGYVMYIVVGVIGVAVSSLFYHYLGRLGGISTALAWIHLILMNAGITAAASMLMIAGYQAGAAMLPTAVGGEGINAGMAHEIIGKYVEPIGAAILVLMAGVIAGGAGFLIAYRRQDMPVRSDARSDTEAA